MLWLPLSGNTLVGSGTEKFYTKKNEGWRWEKFFSNKKVPDIKLWYVLLDSEFLEFNYPKTEDFTIDELLLRITEWLFRLL